LPLETEKKNTPGKKNFFFFFTHYFDREEKMPDLRVLFIDSHGRLWVWSEGALLLDAAKDSFRLFTSRARVGE